MSEVSMIHVPDTPIIDVSASQVSPARQYLRDLPEVFGMIADDLRRARQSARELLPFTWRSTAAREAERRETVMFHIGRTDKTAEAQR